MRTQTQARQLANDVAKQLGEPWKPVVWENLGWHACVQFGAGYAAHLHGSEEGMTLYVHVLQGRYGAPVRYSVTAINRTIGEGRTPLAAVRKAHQELERVRQEAGSLMAPLWSAIQKHRR